jgi:hypothetical protein
MVNPRLMKVDARFYDILKSLRTDIETTRGEKVSYPRLTRDLSGFFMEENLPVIIKRRAEHRFKMNRGGLF